MSPLHDLGRAAPKRDHLRDREAVRPQERLSAAVAAGGKQFEGPPAVGLGKAISG
jgi:hypothetical protein